MAKLQGEQGHHGGTLHDQPSAAGGLDRASLATLATYATAHRYSPGARPTRDDDTDGALYLVAEGQLRLICLAPDGREAILTLLHPGSVWRRTHGGSGTRLEATSACALVYTIPQHQILAIASAHPALAGTLLDLLDRQLSATYERIADLALHGVRARVARILARLALAAPDRVVRASHQELADLACTSREEVSRAMRTLRGHGQITGRTHQRRIVVRDPSTLLAL